MSLQVCSDCGTSYLEAPLCPHCGGGVFRFNWEEEMPKITSAGDSHYSDTDPDHPYPQDEPVPAPKARVAAVRAKNAAAEVKAAQKETSDGEGM